MWVHCVCCNEAEQYLQPPMFSFWNITLKWEHGVIVFFVLILACFPWEISVLFPLLITMFPPTTYMGSLCSLSWPKLFTYVITVLIDVMCYLFVLTCISVIMVVLSIPLTPVSHLWVFFKGGSQVLVPLRKFYFILIVYVMDQSVAHVLLLLSFHCEI